MATRSEITSRVLRALARSGAPTTTQADVVEYLHATIREDVCGDHNWPFMKRTGPVFQTTEDMDIYPVPESEPGVLKDVRMVEVRTTSDGEWCPLKELSEEALYEVTHSTVSGVPSVFALASENEIRINIPDDAYDMRVLTHEYPPELALDTSTNFLTDRYPRLLEYGVCARMFLYFEQPTMHQLYERLFQGEKGRIVGLDRRVAGEDFPVLRQVTAAGRRTPRRSRGRLDSWPMSYDD